jgi:hypothetical protein
MPRKLVKVEPKPCQRCGKLFHRSQRPSGQWENVPEFHRRKYCSLSCLSACDAAGSIVQGQKVQEGEVRGLRDREETTCSPHRREPVEQRPGEHSDPMRELSWVLAQHARALWEAYWRSNATAYPLLSHGEKNRVGRLRAYGNAIVPPLAAEVIRAFMESAP